MDATPDWVTASDNAARAIVPGVAEAVTKHVVSTLSATAAQRPLTTGELQSLAREIIKLSTAMHEEMS